MLETSQEAILPAESVIDPHAKDLTGYILTWRD